MAVRVKPPTLFDEPKVADPGSLDRLVGQRFKKGAELAMTMLPDWARVILWREPSNPFDPNAIAVMVEESQFDPDDWQRLRRTGASLDGGRIALGFMKREGAADLAPRMDQQGLTEIKGTLDTETQGLAYIITH